MKGLIAYSSRSGNTEKLAIVLENGLADLVDWTMAEIKDNPDVSGYDVVLVGAWIDRGFPNAQARDWLDKLPPTRLGLFVTMGAMPDSAHGDIIYNNLESLLEKHDSLGVVCLPGHVEEAVLDRVRKMPPGVLPDSILRQMIDAGETSRWATNEEYFEAIDFFKEKLEALKA